VAVIPKTIQGSVTNVPKKVVPRVTQPTRQYFGTPSAATALGNQQYLANNFGYKGDVPGTPANPSAPTYLQPDGSYSTTPTNVVTTPATAGHWNTTDWASMIPGDWEVSDAEAQGNKMQGEAEAAFQKSLRQAFIDYGGDSSKLGDYSKYIDAPTIEAAQSNKFSQVAQNLAQMTKSLRQQRATLAARGMGSSGANTEATRQALAAKEQNDYTGLRSFLGGADQGTAGLAQTRQTIADKIAAARSSAAARLAAAYPNTWEEGTPESTSVVPVPGATPPPAAAAPPAAGTVNWGGTQKNAAQMAAELARTGVNRATWIRNHPGAAATLGWA
jgi:hypothetical protein